MADIITKGATDQQDIPVRWHDNGDSTWSMQVYSAGGGGGGAATIADGADVAEGAKADAAYTTGSGSVVSILKGIFGRLLQYVEDAPSTGGENLTLAGVVRQDTIAASTNTDGDYATLKSDSLGRLYTVTSAQGGTMNAASVVSVTGTAGTLFAAAASRKGIVIRSDIANTQSCYYGPATVSSANGMEIKPGEIHSYSGSDTPTNLIQAISASGTQSLRVQDVT